MMASIPDVLAEIVDDMASIADRQERIEQDFGIEHDGEP